MSIVLDGTTGITTPGLTNTGTETLVNLTTTGNTTLGDASGDTLTVTGGTTTFTQGTANGVAYLNGSKVLTTGSALTFNGSAFAVTGNITSTTVQIGTNPAGVSIGVLGIPNQKRIYGRNAANSADVNILYVDSSNGLVLGPSDSAVIDASGNLLVGTTSSGVTNSNSVTVLPAFGQINYQHASGTSSGANYAYFAYNASGIGSITQNGTTGVLYNLTSDYRLKNDQQPLTGAKDFIMALKPKKWQWWDGSGEGVGFVAHEFMEVAKYSGNGEKDAIDADGKPIMQSIQPSSSEVMANLVSFIQEQQAIITTLTDRITALENK